MGTRPASIPYEVEFSNCPICETDGSVVWMDDHKPTRYVRCTHCGTVYASPRSSHLTRYKWLENTFSAGQVAFENAAKRRSALGMEAAIIHRYIKGGAMLDIGCDLGDLFKWFPGPAWQRYGVEVSASAAAYAAETHSASVFPGTIRQLAFPECSFDLVTMMDMLYFPEDPLRDLGQVARILKPNGLLAIELCGQSYQLCRSRGPLCLLLDRRWTRLQTDSAFLNWFSPAGLRRLLNKSGFEILDWQVIPSPDQPNLLFATLSRSYFRLISSLADLAFNFLDLAPKYMCIAKLR